MRRTEDEVGSVRRVLLMLLGIGMIGAFDDPWPVGWLFGAFGILLLAAAAGIIELGMAVYYRTRRRLARNAARAT